jgi:hypothetical protein
MQWKQSHIRNASHGPPVAANEARAADMTTFDTWPINAGHIVRFGTPNLRAPMLYEVLNPPAPAMPLATLEWRATPGLDDLASRAEDFLNRHDFVDRMDMVALNRKA